MHAAAAAEVALLYLTAHRPRRSGMERGPACAWRCTVLFALSDQFCYQYPKLALCPRTTQNNNESPDRRPAYFLSKERRCKSQFLQTNKNAGTFKSQKVHRQFICPPLATLHKIQLGPPFARKKTNAAPCRSNEVWGLKRVKIRLEQTWPRTPPVSCREQQTLCSFSSSSCFPPKYKIRKYLR